MEAGVHTIQAVFKYAYTSISKKWFLCYFMDTFKLTHK